MLIYNTQRNGRSKVSSFEVSSETNGNRKKRVKNGNKQKKKGYKSRSKRTIGVNQAKVTGGDRAGKSKQKKKLTKKNKDFLERIGLKVKQND